MKSSNCSNGKLVLLFFTGNCYLVFLLIILLLSPKSYGQSYTVTINCTGTTGSFNSGSVSSAGVKNDGNLININTNENRGWARFDLSGIPLQSTINSVSVIFSVYDGTGSGANAL